MRSIGYYIFNKYFSLLPETRLFGFKRWWLRSFCGANIGKNVRICSSVVVQISAKLTVGDNTWIGEYSKIVGGNAEVIIGSNVDIGPEVLLVTGSHELWTLEHKAAGKGFSKPIIIEDGVWLGARSTILGNVIIGKKSMIAAGAVINKYVPEQSLFGGVPAKLVKKNSQ
jgi:acetyltransferase-like isoleucine patch superfamily enzyme